MTLCSAGLPVTNQGVPGEASSSRSQYQQAEDPEVPQPVPPHAIPGRRPYASLPLLLPVPTVVRVSLPVDANFTNDFYRFA